MRPTGLGDPGCVGEGNCRERRKHAQRSGLGERTCSSQEEISCGDLGRKYIARRTYAAPTVPLRYPCLLAGRLWWMIWPRHDGLPQRTPAARRTQRDAEPRPSPCILAPGTVEPKPIDLRLRSRLRWLPEVLRVNGPSLPSRWRTARR